MEAWRSRRSAETRLRVALQAEHVHIAHLQHVRVRSPVRRVASLAPLDLHRLVFEYERPLLVCVALEADKILSRRRPQLMRSLRPVRVMAVRALHQPFIYAMVERHVELRLLSQVARVAESGLRARQQMFRFRVVRRMAGRARNVILRVDRIDRVLLLCRALQMAGQTPFVDLFRAGLFEEEQFRGVARIRNVAGRRSMAPFTSLVPRSFLRVQRRPPVRRFFPTPVDLLVAGLACFGPGVVRPFRRSRRRTLILRRIFRRILRRSPECH